jgi:hypothetical protein
LHRSTIAGDVPVGINGDTSVVRKGDTAGAPGWTPEAAVSTPLRHDHD